MDRDERFILSLQERPPPCITLDPYAVELSKNYRSNRNVIIEYLFELYNRRIFGQKLDRRRIKISWSKRMHRDLGLTIYKFRQPGKHRLTIRLSIAQLTNATLLSSTLLHEMCHVANVAIDNLNKVGHGKAWQFWTWRVKNTFPNIHPITRVEKSVVVNYRFIYICRSCGQTICRRQKRPSLTFRMKLDRIKTRCCGAKTMLLKK